MSSAVKWLEEAKSHVARIAGYVAVADPQSGPSTSDGPQDLDAMIAAFVGPYGDRDVQDHLPGLRWAATLPAADQALSTWSCFQSDRGVCLIEGEFYDSAWGYRPARGIDNQLASMVLSRVLDEGTGRLNDLNGVFSGLVYSTEHRRVTLFVDPIGTRLLYYRRRGGVLDISSNLHGFTAIDPTPSLDPLALNEQLIFGQPIDSKTLLEGVRLVPPGRVVEFDRAGLRQTWCYPFPQREQGFSLQDSVEMITDALEEHVKHLDVPAESCGIGMSGGKDSRAVFASMLHVGVRPKCFVFFWAKEPGDAVSGPRICGLAGMPYEKIQVDKVEDSLMLLSDVAIALEGTFGTAPFLAFAAAVGQHVPLMFTGFGGASLTGGFSGVKPWKLHSADELASQWLEAQGTPVPPVAVPHLLRRDLVIPFDQVYEGYRDYFRRMTADLQDLTTVHRVAFGEHYNRRIVAPIFQMTRTFLTPVHPLIDRVVCDAYMRLPIKHINERHAHALASMRRYPEFGSVPTLMPHIPLKYEYTMRLALEAYRIVRRIKRKRAKRRIAALFQDGGLPAEIAEAPPKQQRLVRILCESELFDRGAIDKYGAALAAGLVPGLTKMAPTAIFAARVSGQRLPSAPEPLFLK